MPMKTLKPKIEVKHKHNRMLSEFSMGLLDFNRLDEILRRVTELFLMLRLNPESSIDLINALKEYYRILRPLMDSKKQKDFDKKFKTLRSAAIDKIGVMAAPDALGKTVFDVDVYDKLDSLADELYTQRQECHMGIPATRKRPGGKAIGAAFDVE